MRRKLAPGTCSNCGVDENNTSLWRTGLDKERLCNACGLYVQTHGKARPTTHFSGRRAGVKNEDGTVSAPNSRPNSRPTSRASTPARQPRPRPPSPSTSSASGSSSELEPSPELLHSKPVGGSAAAGTSGPSSPAYATTAASRASRQPRRPHADPLNSSSTRGTGRRGSSPGFDGRSHSVSRGPRAPHIPRGPPRTRSAPPPKAKSKGKEVAASLKSFVDTPAAATLNDIELLRRAAWAREDVVRRESAMDVVIGGQVHRVPERTIRVDFWNKALGLKDTPSAGSTAPIVMTSPIGSPVTAHALGGSAMTRTFSAPSYAPRPGALLSPDELRAASFSPSSVAEDSFGGAASGGDFSDTESDRGGPSSNGKRFYGPLFGAGGAYERGGAAKGKGEKRRAGSQGASSVRSSSVVSGLDGAVGDLSIEQRALSRQTSPTNSTTNPPSANRSPPRAGESFAPALSSLDSDHQQPAQKRFRSSSPSAAGIPSTLLSAGGTVAPSPTSAPPSPSLQHPTPTAAALQHAHDNLPRASSPLRLFSSTAGAASAGGLPKSHLGEVTIAADGLEGGAGDGATVTNVKEEVGEAMEL